MGMPWPMYGVFLSGFWNMTAGMLCPVPLCEAYIDDICEPYKDEIGLRPGICTRPDETGFEYWPGINPPAPLYDIISAIDTCPSPSASLSDCDARKRVGGRERERDGGLRGGRREEEKTQKRQNWREKRERGGEVGGTERVGSGRTRVGEKCERKSQRARARQHSKHETKKQRSH